MLYSVFTQRLTCCTWYMIYDTGTWYWHRHSVVTPVLGMLYLIPVPRYLIFRHQYLTYVILDTCSWYPVYDLLSCGTSTLAWHHDPWPDTITPDTCIIWHIHDYHFYGDLAWLLYYYQIFGTPELLYSWTHVYLNPWNREAPDITPDIILLLTPVIG